VIQRQVLCRQLDVRTGGVWLFAQSRVVNWTAVIRSGRSRYLSMGGVYVGTSLKKLGEKVLASTFAIEDALGEPPMSGSD
jgi:hypothetical protein